MATIQKRGNSYSIRVSCGYDTGGKQVIQSMTWKPDEGMTERQIQAFVNTLSKEGANERTGKPLAPKTIRHNLSLISDVFSYAVKMSVVSENPCSKVTIPKGEVKEKQIYTPEQVQKFLTLLNEEPLKYRTFFNLMIYSGFRRSEMLGLEWKDIDFEHNIISVRRTSNYTAERGTYTDTTKTKRSQRTLKIAQPIMDLLRQLKEEQDNEALRLGDKWVDTDRLFTKWDGREMNNQTPYGWLKEFCEKNDLPFYGLHSFRHRNNMKTLLLILKYINTYISLQNTAVQDYV